MHISNQRQKLFDDLIDLVSIKSGLLLTGNQALTYLADIEDGWWEGDPTGGVRIEVGEFEEAFIYLMYKVGAVNDTNGLTQIVVAFVKQHLRHFSIKSKNDLLSIVQAVTSLTVNLSQHILFNTSLPDQVLRISGLDDLVNEYKSKYVLYDEMPDSAEWNGKIPLDTLFQGENIPDGSSPNVYFDQRYIDFLNRQQDELKNIHWRQFEYLTGEFFRRNGYEVEVTKGRGDGGIDVIAKKSDLISGPEMIIIQCKQYAETNPIQVETVRAFWATVDDAGATKGVIATTSRLTRGAKEYCVAKRYRLGAVEGDLIRGWISQMAMKNN